jgi:hypothetical protein
MIKNLKILLAATFLSTVIAVGMYVDDKKTTNSIEFKPLFENFDEILPEISHINFKSIADETIIQKIEGTWVVASAYNLPANTDLLSRFFIQLREGKLTEIKTTNEKLYYKLGLDNENKIELLLKNSNGDNLYELNIGEYNYKKPGTYIKPPKTNQTYLASVNLSTDAGSYYWVPNDLVNIGSEQIKSIQIYKDQLINLSKQENRLLHQNLPQGFEEIDQDKIDETLSILTDLQHNGYMLRKDLPASSTFDVRITLENNTVIFMKMYDIEGEGIYTTFDWNYITDELQVSKLIDLNLSGSQLQLSVLSLRKDMAYHIPQQVFDKLNLKLRPL